MLDKFPLIIENIKSIDCVTITAELSYVLISFYLRKSICYGPRNILSIYCFKFYFLRFNFFSISISIFFSKIIKQLCQKTGMNRKTWKIIIYLENKGRKAKSLLNSFRRKFSVELHLALCLHLRDFTTYVITWYDYVRI